jgi:hypothetical protein
VRCRVLVAGTASTACSKCSAGHTRDAFRRARRSARIELPIHAHAGEHARHDGVAAGGAASRRRVLGDVGGRYGAGLGSSGWKGMEGGGEDGVAADGTSPARGGAAAAAFHLGVRVSVGEGQRKMGDYGSVRLCFVKPRTKRYLGLQGFCL